MRLLWMTDIHLNFVETAERDALLAAVAEDAPDAVLLGGDIAEASDLGEHLRRMVELVDAPVYFVLGNHDFYGSSVAKVRRHVRRLCEEMTSLVWLPDAAVVSLTERTALLGHDGWADFRFGNLRGTTVVMSDFFCIADFTETEFKSRMRELAQEAADHFRKWLPRALKTHERVILLTHCPPWAQAAWHEGRRSDDNYLPFFSSKVAGEAIMEIMVEWPERMLTVLCGHTHGEGTIDILPNVQVITGGAVYGSPAAQPVIDVP